MKKKESKSINEMFFEHLKDSGFSNEEISDVKDTVGELEENKSKGRLDIHLATKKGEGAFGVVCPNCSFHIIGKIKIEESK